MLVRVRWLCRLFVSLTDSTLTEASGGVAGGRGNQSTRAAKGLESWGVKEGFLRPLTEKHYNNILNVWCRAPFLCFCVILSWVQVHIQRPPTYVVVCRCLLMGLQIWNAQYFMARVCGNYFVTRYKIGQARKKLEADGDGAKLEALSGPRKRGKKGKRARADSVTDEVGAADEHPLPSAFEGVLEPRRNVRFNQFSRAWDFVRGGS